MSGLVLLAHTPDVVNTVTNATSGQVVTLVGEQARNPQLVAQNLGNGSELVLIEAGDNPQESLQIANWATERFGVPVVLISDDATLGLSAMRSGVRDMMRVSANPDEVRDTIARNRRRLSAPAETQRGRIVTVASPKGGVGKTTVTTNVAIGLVRATGLPVVLVDLDLHFGDVATALNLNPEYALPETAKAAAGGDALALKPYLAPHETGLWVVAGADDPVAADQVTAQEVTTLLRTLSTAFAYVVVDTSPGLSEHTLAALDLTSDLILVTGLDVPGVRGLRKEIQTLGELQMLMESRQIVLNFADNSRGLTVADVEASIGAKVDTVIPTTNLIPISVNQGIPLTQSAGKDKVTKELDQVVARLVGHPVAEPKKGLFSRRKESQ
ncbi:AAA family ATPase [Propionibacteriaceae bacterium G1746]|uniref:AAA family ATPase n=1 Tax=Aestuariimicrobium sp. G57 TaxID=3418485 RepID=UPI003C27144B